MKTFFPALISILSIFRQTVSVPQFTCIIAIFLLHGAPLAISHSQAEETLFVATPFTEINSFTAGIEGPACDKAGNVYAVNFAEDHTIGKVTPNGEASIFVKLGEKSTGNGIRFDKAGQMFVADYQGHNILKIDMQTKAITVHAHEDRMSQPNDIAIMSDGTLFASDPNWAESKGKVWRIDLDGTVHLADGELGTANGIEVSPDGTKLYVNESVQLNVWEYTIAADKSLTEKKLLIKFDDFGMDGMRCDVDGNIYITRYGKGTVIKLSPTGNQLQEINVLGERPSNICFGGPEGKTAYVTEVQHQRLVKFHVDRPGLAWQRWQEK